MCQIRFSPIALVARKGEVTVKSYLAGLTRLAGERGGSRSHRIHTGQKNKQATGNGKRETGNEKQDPPALPVAGCLLLVACFLLLLLYHPDLGGRVHLVAEANLDLVHAQ